MRSRLLRRALTLSIALTSALTMAEEPVLRLCADSWMPYNGDPDDARPGYVVELAREVFASKGIAVEYTVTTWEEALAAVREGRMSGAIGANVTEAEGLLLPAESIGAPQVCLLTRADSTWDYENIASFRHVRLGVIKEYSYWEALDKYIARSNQGRVVVAESDAPLDELMTLLESGGVDVVAESEPVLLWFLREHELDRSRFRVVYKHVADPIFVVFAANDEGRRFAAVLDEGVRTLRASGRLGHLLRRYGLADWK